jgi:predicted phosphodiesterase
VRTAVVSDIHLGKAAGNDVVRRPEVRRRLLEGIAAADRLVLLGDVVELRESPLADAMAAARPFFEELGDAFAGKPVVLVPGNHDYQLGASLRQARALDGGRAALRVADSAPPPADGPLARIADWARPAELELAYPGVWLRDDVYATHGHYLDWHNTVPTIEVLAIGIAERIVRHGPRVRDRMTPDDYEAALAPVYELAYTLAQSSRNGRQLAGGGRSARMWERLTGQGGGARARAEAAVANAGVHAGVATLNRLGLGPLDAELSGVGLRRAGLRSMAAVAHALGIDARHVIFGHTHRSGPWPRDGEGWALPGGGRLTNSGSWIHEPVFVGDRPAESPYLPGVVVWVDDDAEPRLERLLDPDDVARALSGT